MLDTLDDKGVPDRNLENVRNFKKAREILQVQIMPGIYTYPGLLHCSGGVQEPVEDHLAFG